MTGLSREIRRKLRHERRSQAMAKKIRLGEVLEERRIVGCLDAFGIGQRHLEASRAEFGVDGIDADIEASPSSP